MFETINPIPRRGGGKNTFGHLIGLTAKKRPSGRAAGGL